MSIIGQRKLLSTLNSFTLDTFPRSCIFIGEKGIGKHTFVNYIKENILKLPLIDITDNISYEYILDIYQNPNPAIYFVNLSTVTEATQNALLKFLEEPLNNSFICLIAESKANVLPTILNRCRQFLFEPYSREELSTFITEEKDRDLLLFVLRTPGKILNSYVKNMSEMLEICNKIVNKLNIASFPNTLSIARKINFKDQYDKYDLDIFLDMLCIACFNDYIKSNSNRSLYMYQLIKSEKQKLVDSRLNKEIFFDHLLTILWKAAR